VADGLAQASTKQTGYRQQLKNRSLRTTFVALLSELCTISNVYFTDDAILRGIKNIKPSLSVDGLCAYYLKQISFSILQLLKTIFELSFRTGTIPTMDKCVC
jgi:hypothetical protein